MTRTDKIEWLLYHDYINDESEVESLTDDQLNKKYKDSQDEEAEKQYYLWLDGQDCGGPGLAREAQLRDYNQKF